MCAHAYGTCLSDRKPPLQPRERETHIHTHTHGGKESERFTRFTPVLVASDAHCAVTHDTHITSTGTPTSVNRVPIFLHGLQNEARFLSEILGQEYVERITWAAEPARLGPQHGCVYGAHAGRCGLSSICQLSHVVSWRQNGRRKTLPREGLAGL